MDAGGAQLDEDPTDRPSTHTNFAPTRIASPMSHESSYTSPSAFRRALTDKLRALAVTSRWTVHQLQRQMAYDRLLERLYLVDDDWIVKGATALLARNLGVRATIDVDVFRAVTQEVAEADLREAARRDIGDWFRFDVGPTRPVSDGAAGTRFPVTAFLGASEWALFHVDLVGSDLPMTGEPEAMPPLAPVMMPEVAQHGYRVYPLVDHVADKVAAILERHGDGGRPSTRFKDLVDLVAIITGASVDADQQKMALSSEAERRGLILPDHFAVPDREIWERGYAREAQRSLLPIAHSLDDALEIARAFVDPLLDIERTATGTWDPQGLHWGSPIA